MSYDINLCDPVTKQIIVFDTPHQMRGGTYAIGGTNQASLNITYNYSKHYYRMFGDDGIRSIYGKTGAEAISLLEQAIAKLGDDVDDNYWEPTEGNAKRALCQLLALAKMRPDGVFQGD
jgi:hypothetical protein